MVYSSDSGYCNDPVLQQHFAKHM